MTSEEMVVTDSDPEISDDETMENDEKLIYSPIFPDKCDDEIKGIESFYACFQKRYDACPAFCTGPLSAACDAAFSSRIAKERCPLLVYIHDDESMFNNIFCKTTFCSEMIINYLVENYVVWPWDITSEWNELQLIQMWEEVFSSQLSNSLSVKECPVLIGIMRRSAKDKNWTSKCEYQFKLLLKGETLMRTSEKSSPQRVLNELVIFKEECDDNEQALSFDFVNKTGLCWEMVLEIAKYLSLNDAINAFSDNILDSLRKHKTRVQISKPSQGFINMILRKIHVEQIVSLHLDAIQLEKNTKLLSSTIFTNVISLTLFNPSNIDEINKYASFFDKLNCLSVWYDTEVNLNAMNNILGQLRRPIRRFEIHCAGILCPHYGYELYTQNLTVRYFLVDVGYFPLSSTIECTQNDTSCVLLATIGFIKSLKNIRYFRLVTNEYNVGKVLDCNYWNSLIDTCSQLKKVTIEMLHSILSGEQLVQKALEMKKQ